MAFLNASALLVLSGFFAAAALGATPPKLEHLYPVAGQQGTTLPVAAAGKFEPWPPQVWVDAPGISFKAGASGKFDVEIAKDAIPGPHLVRFYNESGVSAPRFFIVSSEPELAEKEPNDSYKASQLVPALPATFSGRLDKGGDVDSFGVSLKKGETLVAWLEAYLLGSAFDGLFRITDSNGTQLAFNHDGRTLDPFLAWEAPYDGIFVLQLMGFVYPASSDVRLAGGEGGVYRLHLTTGPYLRYTLPLAFQSGKTTVASLVGWNLAAPSVEVDGTQFGANAATFNLPLAGSSTRFPVMVSELPEMMENSPAGEAVQLIETPGAITGHIDSATDEDRFQFTAGKGRVYEFRLFAASIGSPLDAWIKIEDDKGKEVARNDDSKGSRDPQLIWTAPADGNYVAVIGDVSHQGGAEFVYRLAIGEAKPAVTATAAEHSLVIEAGKSGDLKVVVKRVNGSKANVKLIARNLPDGVVASDPEIPEKGGDVALKLSVQAEVKPVSQPFTLVLREAESGKESAVSFYMTTEGEDNGVPQGYGELVISSTDQLWLIVLSQQNK
ncbi:MAG: Peptidase domain protein [Chthoniobacteraceae bacterium]|nr:Peptidase domain protein [Chthoniobacteraceae bacterium]